MSANILSKLGMFLVEDFLDAQFCAQLREEARADTGFQATIDKRGVMMVDETIRSTKRARVSPAGASQVKAHLEQLKPRLEEHFKVTLSGYQEPQFLVYREGDFFEAHRDNSRDPRSHSDINTRQISTVIFLNDESPEPAPDTFGGGDLTLYEVIEDPKHKSIGFPLTGKTGLLIAFPSDKLHQVTPVTYGERFTVVSWFF